jgi:hypothetical protein
MTQLPLEMNFIIFYNVDTLSTTVRISSQVTLEIGLHILLHFNVSMIIVQRNVNHEVDR